MSNFTTESLEDKLRLIDWSSFFDAADPEECWKIMYEALFQTLNDLCPIREQVNVKRKAYWITQELFELMKARDAKLSSHRTRNKYCLLTFASGQDFE